MIDLDDQLDAYGSYLDDTEQSVTVLHPRAVTADNGSARWLAIAAAAVLVVGGSIGIATIRSDDGATTGSADSEWTVVPDPEGVFVPMSADPSDVANSINVLDVTATANGFIAVGSESRGAALLGAVWQSVNGQHWERVTHDASFDFSADGPGNFGPGMRAVDEYDGTVIIAGWGGLDDDRQVWLSDDLDEWRTPDLPGALDTGVTITSVAASDTGFVVAGIHPADSGSQDTSAVWFSSDGREWSQAELEDVWGSDVFDVMATDDGWYAAGSAASEAALWRSDDGLTWERLDVAGSPYPGINYTEISTLVEAEGAVVGYGSASSIRHSQGTGQGMSLVPVIWMPDESGWVATGLVDDENVGDRLYAGPIVHAADGFTAFAMDWSGDRLVAVEFTSDDGVSWERRVVGLGGPRDAAATANGVTVAIGDAVSRHVVLDDESLADLPDGAEFASNVWIRHD